MKLFFVDDSNITVESKLGFFVYGGLVVEDAEVRDLMVKFLKIKEKYGIAKNIEIKWDNINKISPSLAKNIKEDVLDLVKDSNCKIIVYLAPHIFYHDGQIKIKNGKFHFKSKINHTKYIKALEFATNVCLQKFNQYLDETDSYGLVLSDESDSCDREMASYCATIFPEGTQISPLKKIIHPVILVNSKYSQMHQINDVVLGAIQYSLKETQFNFLPILKNNFWCKRVVSGKIATGYGFNVYPKKAQTEKMKKDLEKLAEKFKRLINKKI